jgi:hypothetical protein
VAGCKCINQNTISYIWILFIPLHTVWWSNSSRNSMCCSLSFSPISSYGRWQMNTLVEIGIHKIFKKKRAINTADFASIISSPNSNHKNITFFFYILHEFIPFGHSSFYLPLFFFSSSIISINLHFEPLIIG